MDSKACCKNKSALTQHQGLCIFETSDEEIDYYDYFEDDGEIMGLEEPEIIEMDIEILENWGITKMKLGKHWPYVGVIWSAQ
mmetsp:Transcript_19472/g.19486  ORF Transcript_19472/g.19486 Transcript_19472/m.19486 type:complete len:82 (+) Transcript_19472:404-649(+)